MNDSSLIVVFAGSKLRVKLCFSECHDDLVLPVVFMGSKKYRDENDFDSYVTSHSGSSNAYTECEQVGACNCQ